MTTEEGEDLERRLNTTDLSVSIEARRESSQVRYDVEVRNAGPNPSSATTLTVRLEGPAAWTTPPSGCRIDTAAVVRCEVGDVEASASAAIALTATPAGTGSLSAVASVRNQRGPDVAEADNDAAVTIELP